MAGIYIHIPFCKQACHYCDFHFSTQQGYRQAMCDAIAKELELQASYLSGELVETIYWGGGTPSVLHDKELTTIFDSIYKHFSIDPLSEITLEANPDDLTKHKLRMLRLAGVNRLSIGVQSFDEATLRFFNRAHSQADAVRCIADARDEGFSNISIDLIYSVPDRADEVWESDLNQITKYKPEHVSAYSLTIEEKTVFGKWRTSGKLMATSEAASVSDFEMLMQCLSSHGYEHYEISNFCQPGFVSKHNSNYWRQKKYLGVGPSAHSYNGVSRQFTIANNHLYITAIAEGKVPFDSEVLTTENKINEYIFTSLRTAWGCDLNYLASTFHFELENSEAIRKILDLQLATVKNHVLTLSPKGKLLADQIAIDLFVQP